MWPFARKAGGGPARCDVYFRPDATYVLTRMGVSETHWLPGDPLEQLPPEPGPAALGQAVLRCLKASRVVESPAAIKSCFAVRFPDWEAFREDTRGVQVERADELQVRPCRNTAEGFEPLEARIVAEKDLGQAILAAREQAEVVAEPPPDATPEPPRPFGSQCSWLAVRAGAPEKLAEALQLREPVPCSWTAGLERALQGRGVFITPLVGGWCLAVGDLPHPTEEGPAEDPSLLLVGELSQRFAEAQYFHSQADDDIYAWARAREGSIERAFATGDLEWRLGRLTPEEQDFQFFDPTSPEAAGDEYWERTDLRTPDEDCLLKVAARWSVDPSAADSGSEKGVGVWGKR